MSLSVRTRFEVFKRDRFTCAYCGNTPPNVLLEVDHIIPVAAGGTDDLTNLVTACFDCNRGKTDRLLDEGTAPAVSQAAIDQMQERVEQAKAYMETLATMEALTGQMLDRVYATWARSFGATTEERPDGTFWVFSGSGRFPQEQSIRRFLRNLPLDDVLYAVEQTAGRMGYPSEGACRYFYAVCHGMIRLRQQVR